MKLISLNINIPANGQETEFSKPFLQGYKPTGVFFKPHTTNSEIVNVKFEDSNGNTVVDPIDIMFLEKGNQGFDPSTAFPLKIDKGNTIEVTLKSEAPMTQEFKGQLLFILEKNNILSNDSCEY